MTLKNNRAHLLSYFKLCASFHSHLSIQNGVTVRKRQIWVKIGVFLSRVTLKFDGWPWKTIGHLFYAPSSFVYHFIAFCEIKMKLESGNTKFGSKSAIFLSRVTLKFDRWPWKTIGHLFYAILSFCASFDSHLWIQNGVTVLKHSIWVKIGDFLSRVTLKFDGWPWKTIGHLFYAILSFCASFDSHLWIQNGVTVRKRQIWVKIIDFLSCVTLTFDLWPWPFAWTSLLSLVMTPENFMMIRWWEHSEKGVTGGQTDGRTEPFIELLGRC